MSNWGALLIGTVMWVVNAYVLVRDRLYARQDAVSERISSEKKLLIFRILLVVETVVVLLSLFLSSDKSEWAYTILSSTPAGGVLNFFYNPAEYTIALNLRAWMLSGLNFLLVAVVTRETDEIIESKVLLLLHSVLFTVFVGVLSNLFTNYVFGGLLSLADTGLAKLPLLARIFPLLLKVALYLVSIVFLVITIRALIDNLKTLAIVLGAELLFLILVNIIIAIVQSSGGNDQPLQGFHRFLVFLFYELPRQQGFLVQLILTLIFTLFQNLALVFSSRAKESFARLDEEMAEDAVISAARFHREYAAAEERERAHMEEKEDFAAYQHLLASYGEEGLLARAQEILQKRDQVEKEVLQEVEHDYDPDLDPQSDEGRAQLRRLLAQDARRNCLTMSQRKYWKMNLSTLLKKYVPDLPTLDRMDRSLSATAFARNRLGYQIDRAGFGSFTGQLGVGVSILALAVTLLGALIGGSVFGVICRVVTILALLGCWFVVLRGIIGFFCKDKSKKYGWPSLIALLLALGLTWLMQARLAAGMQRDLQHLQETMSPYVILPLLTGIFFSAICRISYLKKPLFRLKAVQKASIQQVYYNGNKEAGDELANTAEKKRARQQEKELDLLIGVVARYDEIKEKLQGPTAPGR